RITFFQIVIAALCFVAFVYALAPATQSDGIRYHLGALSEWSKAGRISFLPHLSFASFPFLVEMHFLPGFGLFSDPIPAGVFAKVTHWCLLVWSLRALAALTRHFTRCWSTERQDAAARMACFC